MADVLNQRSDISLYRTDKTLFPFTQNEPFILIISFQHLYVLLIVNIQLHDLNRQNRNLNNTILIVT